MTVFNGETGAAEVVTSLAGNIRGKTFLITGASQKSLGAEVATSLATASPNAIILVGRNKNKVDPVLAAIHAIDQSINLTFVDADLLDNDTIRKAATVINDMNISIDSMICSAGIMAVRDFTPSKDGIESQFAANHVGHFLLANLIAGKFAVESTFVTVTSSGYGLCAPDFDNYNFQEGKTYNPWTGYAQATTAKILLAYAFAKRPGIAAFSVHPGYVPDTALQASNNVGMDLMIAGFEMAVKANNGKPFDPPPTRTLQQGAATIILAAVDPVLKEQSPAYMTECEVQPALPYATSDENVLKLWQLSEKLVGEKFVL